jgi:hypothetical protein
MREISSQSELLPGASQEGPSSMELIVIVLDILGRSMKAKTIVCVVYLHFLLTGYFQLRCPLRCGVLTCVVASAGLVE